MSPVLGGTLIMAENDANYQFSPTRWGPYELIVIDGVTWGPPLSMA